MLDRIAKNAKMILKKTFSIGGIIFTAMSILLSFITWQEIGVESKGYRIIIFIAIIIASLTFATIYICLLKNKVTIWEKGNAKIVVRYADIMKIAFSNKNKKDRIVVIPVNTCFDTIVDDDIQAYDKPLVSPNTLHGKWINKMLKKGVTIEELNKDISSFFDIKNINPICELSKEEKDRGQRKKYSKGTIAIVKGNEKVKFFLLALSDFDKNNNAQCSKDEFIDCLHKLIVFYNKNGQGMEMFLPLMGTNLSRVGLSSDEALNIIELTLKLYSDKIHGKINIVVYNKEKDNIAIYKK